MSATACVLEILNKLYDRIDSQSHLGDTEINDLYWGLDTACDGSPETQEIMRLLTIETYNCKGYMYDTKRLIGELMTRC